MTHAKHIIKRHGHEEPWDPKKLYATIYRACMGISMNRGESEMCAEKVTKDVEKEIMKKSEVRSHQIKTLAEKKLREINPDAAYMYRTHLDVN